MIKMTLPSHNNKESVIKGRQRRRCYDEHTLDSEVRDDHDDLDKSRQQSVSDQRKATTVNATYDETYLGEYGHHDMYVLIRRIK